MTYDRGMLQASLLPSLPSQPASHARGVCSLCVAVDEQEETHKKNAPRHLKCENCVVCVGP